MLVAPSPIYVEDILATGTSDSPVGVDCAAQGRMERPLAHGWVHGESTQQGMAVSAADYTAFEDYAVRTSIENGFFIGLNLGAPQVGETGKLSWELGTGQVVAFRTQEPMRSRLTRVGGTQLMRCGVWLEEDWLASGRLEQIELSGVRTKELLASHMTPWQTAATSAIWASAQRIKAAMGFEDALSRLRRETAGLNLLFQTLAHLNPDATRSIRAPSNRDLARLKHVRELLDCLGPQEDVSLTEIATQVGMSVRSLSRHFRSAFGITVLAYVSETRMAQARKVLESGEGSIDLAAYIGGFVHTANFARAFKQRYGCTPGSVPVRSRWTNGRRR